MMSVVQSVKSAKSVIFYLLLRVHIRFLIFMKSINRLGRYGADTKSLISPTTLIGACSTALIAVNFLNLRAHGERRQFAPVTGLQL